MATGLIAALANSTLDTLGATYRWVKLHTGDPGSAGTSNAATETTRKQVTWASATGGVLSNSADLNWTSVAGTEDYTHFSVWSASTSGTCGFTGTITANAVTTGDDFKIASGDLDVSFPVAS